MGTSTAPSSKSQLTTVSASRRGPHSKLRNMRGLPFPTNALFDRETTSEVGTPASHVDDIPIDPALAGTALTDTAFERHSNGPLCDPAQLRSVIPHHDPRPVCRRHYSQEPSQYDQGPRGDPFAPQPPATYVPIQEVIAQTPKPQKRRRKPRREEECGFCQGNDSKNKLGEPELMVSCDECGRSGHPSCMELARVADVMRSYPWRCIECKICEVCHEKGDDERILFCDFCDRGWHMDCLDTPLDKAPPGQWHCPECPPIEFLQPPDAPLTQSDTVPTEPPQYFHVSNPNDPICGLEPEPEVDVEAGAEDSAEATEEDESESESESSSSDSGSDESTVGAPTPRRPSAVKKKRPKRKSEPARPPKRMRLTVRPSAPPLVVRLRIPPKGKGKDREEDPEKNIFEDLLAPAERDVSKTAIESTDRTRFDRSRLAADEKLAPPPPPTSATDVTDSPVAGPSSRPLRSHTLHQISIPSTIPTPSPVPSTPSLHPNTPGYSFQSPNTPAGHEQTPVLRIRIIRFGRYDIHPWYDAPFPEEYANIPDGRLWICEFCLKYMRSGFAFGRHKMKCKARHPPGDEIYRDGQVSIFEVDGRKNKIYCQNLCLLSKMFLDHKSLFYDVEPFLFYVMTEFDDIGARFVGYFSKEKCSPKDYNVSCIMTLPVRQRQGWGGFLIDFSYLLSKKERRTGSPEKPLSALGALGYKNYWTLAIMRYLKTAPPRPSLEDISRATSMTLEDIYNTLVQQDMITQAATPPPVRPSPGQSIKFPRGRKNGIARRHLQRTNTQKEEEGSKQGSPLVLPTRYEISWDPDVVDRWLESWEQKGYLKVKLEKLKWTPFFLTRTKATGEILQSEMGIGIETLSGGGAPKTPVLPSENGTPAAAVDESNNREKLPAPDPVEVAKENRAAVGDALTDVSEASAARLFDDLLIDSVATPKKQLRSRVKDDNSNTRLPDLRTRSSIKRHEDHHLPPLRHTRSSRRLVVDEDDDDGDVPNIVNGNLADDLAAVPAKRRGGRLSRKPSSSPPEPCDRVIAATPRSRSPPPSATSCKRRRIDTPSRNGSLSPSEPASDERRADPFIHPMKPVINLTNGQSNQSNGVSWPPSSPEQRSATDAKKGQEEPVRDCSHADGANGFCDDQDVKTEDVGTPLTGLTCQQSASSDYTVVVTNQVNGGGLVDKSPNDIRQSTMLPEPFHSVLIDGPVNFGEVHDSDLDAEGDTDDEM